MLSSSMKKYRKKLLNQGKKKWMEIGKEKWMEKGKEIGIEKKTIETIITMHKLNYSIKDISAVTKLSVEEIEKIIKEE